MFNGEQAFSSQARYSKDRSILYDTSRLKNWFCVNKRYTLLKTLALKSNKRGTAINNPSPPLIAKP